MLGVEGDFQTDDNSGRWISNGIGTKSRRSISNQCLFHKLSNLFELPCLCRCIRDWFAIWILSVQEIVSANVVLIDSSSMEGEYSFFFLPLGVALIQVAVCQQLHEEDEIYQT